MRADGPDPIDVHVGKRVRLRRTLMGLSQGELGNALGLTFQQVQKYEHGTNRIAASTLYRLSHTLDVPISFFFDDMPEDMVARTSAEGKEALIGRESLDLLRHYHHIGDQIRKAVYDLIKVMARSDDDKRHLR